jgi:hypothetical protein
MRSNMTSLLILVYQPDNSREAVDGIAAALCPYLGTFGEQARISATERLRELRRGEESAFATLLRVTLAGTARVEFSTLTGRLAKFLKQTAKDAHVEARFDIYCVKESIDATESAS